MRLRKGPICQLSSSKSFILGAWGYKKTKKKKRNRIIHCPVFLPFPLFLRKKKQKNIMPSLKSIVTWKRVETPTIFALS